MVSLGKSVFLLIKLFRYGFVNIVPILFLLPSPANALILVFEDYFLRQVVKEKHPNKMQVSLPSLLLGL